MYSKCRITALGSYTPSKVLKNEHLEQMVDTSDEWIVRRTGIRERRIAADNEYTSHLCCKAVEDMLEHYPVTIQDVDMILVATYTPDFSIPSVASLIQHYFNIEQTGALDVNAACAGFVYALSMANALISAGMNRKILVLGADTVSKIIDYSDRSSCILFGDGAGAVLLEGTEAEGDFLKQHFGSDGNGGLHLYRTSLSSHMFGTPLDNAGMLMQNGRAVYRFAVETVPEGVRMLLDQLQWKVDMIDWFIPHSANLRMIESISKRIGIPMTKTLSSVEQYGNTSSATIPLTLDSAVKAGKIQTGDRLLMYGFGGGFTHGGMVLNWSLQS